MADTTLESLRELTGSTGLDLYLGEDGRITPEMAEFILVMAQTGQTINKTAGDEYLGRVVEAVLPTSKSLLPDPRD